MSIPVIAFFNNKGGVGKTSLVYHLAWMFSDLGVNVMAADLDPQSNLTSAFMDEDSVAFVWENHISVFGCVLPLLKGTGDIADPVPYPVDEHLYLLTGDLLLSSFEDQLSSQWPLALSRDERAFRVLSSFSRIMQKAAASTHSKLVLVDLGPNLGSINRAALIAADFVVVPLSPDLFSLQGLRNLGSKFAQWRQEWGDRLQRQPPMDIELPAGRMSPLGYVVLQHSLRLDRPVKAYEKWLARIPAEYRQYVLNEAPASPVLSQDPHRLASLKHYRSLMPMAQEARKPIFHLKPADGAIGAHFQAVNDVRKEFKALALTIAQRAYLKLELDGLQNQALQI